MKRVFFCIAFLALCTGLVGTLCRPSVAVGADETIFTPAPTQTEYTKVSLSAVRPVSADVAEVAERNEEKATQTDIPALASSRDIDLLARTIWGEAEGVKSRDEQAAVAWCVLNRVDTEGKSIENTILAPHQFYCRTWDLEVPFYFIDLAQDVVYRWEREHAGEIDVGRTLPADYLYFLGDGTRNHFTVEWKGTECWDWSLPSPYELEVR